MTTADVTTSLKAWQAGGAGCGGGGALALRVGHALSVGTNGVISARGGDGVRYSTTTLSNALPSPGGGGAGGAILLQVDGTVQQDGTIDVSGGVGSSLHAEVFAGLGVADCNAGSGGFGLARLEVPGMPAPSLLGQVDGPPSLPTSAVGPLLDRDTWTGMQSKWYAANPPANFRAPVWQRYVLTARIGGQSVQFSDDPASGNPTALPGQPVQLFVQGARVDANREPLGTPGPWRSRVADLNNDQATGVRFLLLFDRSMQSDVVVTSVAIDFEP